MTLLLDTVVAIHLRDGDPHITDKVASVGGAIFLSVITRVELEGGVYRYPQHASLRRARLDAILAALPTLVFDEAAANAYGAIVAETGYSRRKLLDRMIAAQAIMHRASLVTRNPGDYADITGLSLIGW